MKLFKFLMLCACSFSINCSASDIPEEESQTLSYIVRCPCRDQEKPKSVFCVSEGEDKEESKVACKDCEESRILAII